MATIRRAGFGTVFELEDSKVGIGTDAATHTLQALGNIRSEGVQDVGISSLTTYQGFTDKEARFTGGQIDIESQSGSTSGEIVIDGDVTVSSATTFTSGPQHLTVTDTFTLPSGDTNSRALKPTAGSLRFNQDFATLEFYTGNNWATVNTFTDIKHSPSSRGRGVFGGGLSGTSPYPVDKSIEFLNMASTGNALSFGDLTGTHRGWISAFSSEIRGIWNSGSDYPGNNNSAIIDYVTIASEGDAIDFGDPTFNSFSKTSCSSSTRGLSAGGYSSSNLNTIEYVEISTLGNALDFGDLITTTRGMGASGNPTRGIFAGGIQSTHTTDISFVTISSKGNAARFGDLTVARRMDGGGQVSDSVRGLFWNAGGFGYAGGDGIESINIASEGNALFFADGLRTTDDVSCSSSRTRGVFASGYIQPGGPATNIIQFVTFSTSGQVLDFGDMSVERFAMGGCSDSHGGLGGF